MQYRTTFMQYRATFMQYCVMFMQYRSTFCEYQQMILLINVIIKNNLSKIKKQPMKVPEIWRNGREGSGFICQNTSLTINVLGMAW